MKLADKPALQVEALNQLVGWIAAGQDYGEQQVSALVESLLTGGNKRRSARPAAATGGFEPKKFQSRVRSTIKLVSDLDAAGWGRATKQVAADEALTADLRQLRRIINQILPE
jgi:hypothetical protein